MLIVHTFFYKYYPKLIKIILTSYVFSYFSEEESFLENHAIDVMLKIL